MSNFLEPTQCLVYLQTKGSTSEVAGYTYIARNIRMFYEDNQVFYEVRLETTADGKPTIARNSIFVTADRIVSNKAYVPIAINRFYHYSDNGIVATNFVFKDDRTNPLLSTSRTALGSGIFGTTVVNYDGQKPYLVQVGKPYEVQDAEHGDAITMASLTTNAYIDVILDLLADQPENNLLDISNAITNYDHLVTLWNIVFYRTSETITKAQLGQLLIQYVYLYRKSGNIFDGITQIEVAELPINSIMKFMGYDGLIAVDSYNNGWDRGCVSYNYTIATQITGAMRKDNKSFTV